MRSQRMKIPHFDLRALKDQDIDESDLTNTFEDITRRCGYGKKIPQEYT